MPLNMDPGNALCCSVNAHRNGWAGEICTDPAAWNCNATSSFREDYCARGDDRCFHLRLFADTSPGLIVDETGARWIFDEDPGALDDQILIVWGSQFHEPRGIRQGRTENIVFGGYRVKRVVPMEFGYRKSYRIEPYPGAWFRVANLNMRMPYFREAGGKYVKQLDRFQVTRLLSDLKAKAESAAADSWTDPKDIERLKLFEAKHGDWLDAAAEKVESMDSYRMESPVSEEPAYSTGPTKTSGGLASLRSLIRTEDLTPKASPAAPVPPKAGIDARPQLIEAGQAEWIRKAYGADTLQSLRTASLSKAFVILRGDPGIGKSHLAIRVLDDPLRERTCIVPVSATWRGREDLLGYVNPVSGSFEATEFTLFLAKAAGAWSSGDRRPWLVIFEEFNLSQPEHWLADVLAVSQFQDPLDRRIHLGGQGIKSLDGLLNVTLSPGLSFLATVNTDHTTRPLSPRVLDRAAMVSLTLDPRGALRMGGLTLEDEQVRAVETLHELTRRKGAAFSVRTASSLRICLENRESLDSDSWGVLDLVLSQELLSKVRLLSQDPVDEDVMEALNRWSQEEGSRLSRCSLLIEQWRDLLGKGQDVVQA